MTTEHTIKKAFHVGISSVSLEGDEFTLSEGIKLKKTRCLAIFDGSVEFVSSGGPIHNNKPLSGRHYFRIAIELEISLDAPILSKLKDLDKMRIVIALLRLKCSPAISAPFYSFKPFNDLAADNCYTELICYEVNHRNFVLLPSHDNILKEDDLRWVSANLSNAVHLLGEKEHRKQEVTRFDVALEALDKVYSYESNGAAVLSMWGGLEPIFAPGKGEITFKLSVFISSYLRVQGIGRRTMQNKINSLYGARSTVAHTSGKVSDQIVIDTCILMCDCLVKMIEENRVPSLDDLKDLLLGKIPKVDDLPTLQS